LKLLRRNRLARDVLEGDMRAPRALTSHEVARVLTRKRCWPAPVEAVALVRLAVVGPIVSASGEDTEEAPAGDQHGGAGAADALAAAGWAFLDTAAVVVGAAVQDVAVAAGFGVGIGDVAFAAVADGAEAGPA
jgi:hypothetical protein